MGDLFSQLGEICKPTGAELKILGIEAAADHADKEIEQWGTKAYNYFVDYIKMVDMFKTEDVRVYAEQSGLPEPPTKRAWGAVVLRVARAGLISKNGHTTVNNPKAHHAFVALWKVVK